MLNDLSTPLTFLATRRSGKPRDMVAPGPDAAKLAQILEIAARTPDHGKLFPWRFVIIEDRQAFAALLVGALRAEKPEPKPVEIEKLEQFAHQAPTLVAILSSPRVPSPIPVWEQELSAGAVCQNLLAAVTASGFVGGWLTGWPSYSDGVRDALCVAHEKIAGFVFIGTPERTLEERPRPDMAGIVSKWPD